MGKKIFNKTKYKSEIKNTILSGFLIAIVFGRTSEKIRIVNVITMTEISSAYSPNAG